MSPLLGPRFEQALVHAARWHATQTRKSTRIPYVSHLLAVASAVLEHGGDEDQAIAALLHDAVEDQGGEERLDEIRRVYGDRVGRIVDACSDTYVDPKPPWRARKEEHLRHLRVADEDIKLVVAADKLHNVRRMCEDFDEVGEALWARFNAPKAQQVWYQRSIVEALRNDWESPLVRLLEGEVQRLAERAGIEAGAA